MTPKFRAETAGVNFWLSIGVGKKQSSLPRYFCVPIIRNSVLSAISFNLLSVIYEDILETITELI